MRIARGRGLVAVVVPAGPSSVTSAQSRSGGFGRDLAFGGPGDDLLAGELPPDSEPPPVPPEPAENDRCIGAGGIDTALECDQTIAVEEVQG